MGAGRKRLVFTRMRWFGTPAILFPVVLFLATQSLPALSQATAGLSQRPLSQAARKAAVRKRAPGFYPRDLRCEYRANPMGIDRERPRFFWKIPGVSRGIRQSAYRLLVASDPAILARDKGDMWDSGPVVSDETIQVYYQGRPLSSSTRYYWKVQCRTSGKGSSAFSLPAWFETSIGRWTARWIGDGQPQPQKDEGFYKEDAAPLFIKRFRSPRVLKKAVLYITGLGYYEASLNGALVSDDVLTPGWTDYRKRIPYNSYDVTRLIGQGDNVLGVMLGNGWFNPLPLRLFGTVNLREYLAVGRPCLLAELHLTYTNSDTLNICSDESWKVNKGPLLRNNIYLGECYDAGKLPAGWNTRTFDDHDWPQAAFAVPPAGVLVSQSQEPVRITKRIRPIGVTEPAKGVYIFDMGQNCAGWIRMKLRAPRGHKISFRYGELLFPGGGLNGLTTVAGQIKEISANKGGPGAPATAWQEDEYISDGGTEQYFQQHFTFHGFRYIEVKGLLYQPAPEDMAGLRLSADLPVSGHFTCSNPMFNQLQRMVEWTFLSNVFSVQSDCPAREKLGYGGDMVATAEAFLYNFDMAGLYTKSVKDFEDAARPSGGMTETAPYSGIHDLGLGDGSGPIGWQLAFPFLQERLYEFYGDKKIIEEEYPFTKRLVEFIRASAKGGLIATGIGDHESIAPKDIPLSSAVFYHHIVKLLAGFARILGRREDDSVYSALEGEIREAFLQKFIFPDGRAGSATQASQAFSLWDGLVPPAAAQQALGVLLRNVLDENKGHLSTGIFGTKMMLDVLRRYDRPDIAYTIVDQRSFPGWGYMLANGGTTLWEHWAREDTIYSRNHPMFGSVSEWFYRSLAGIGQAEGSTGFKAIVIRPQPAGLQWVRSRYESIRGSIVSEWKKDPDGFRLHVVIPGNTQAVVCIPLVSKNPGNIKEGKNILLRNGQPVAGAASSIQFSGIEGGYVLFAVGAGDYHFAAF